MKIQIGSFNLNWGNKAGPAVIPPAAPAGNVKPGEEQLINKKNPGLQQRIVPVQLTRNKIDIAGWRSAIAEAERAYFPFRYLMQRMFIDNELNLHVKSCVEKRKDLTLLRKWKFVNAAGVEDEKTKGIFCEIIGEKLMLKQWFINFVSHALDTTFYGYTLISLGDAVNGAFPNLEVVKRWNVSPDRLCVMSFPYNPHGIDFLSPEFKDWYIYLDTPNPIGSSNCGFGLYYYVAMAEIMLRNLFGYNGDYVELFAQPYRVGKTTKIDDERTEFENSIAAMGSSGWSVVDPVDEITFLEAKSAGTGWQGYENFEKRLEAKISKLILGHADALDSTPGKLGSSDGEESAAGNALRDKQTTDGDWITSVVNGLLLPAMRNIGFSIPDDVKGQMVNDNEVMENANALADTGVKIKAAGMQMDPAYFTEQTTIPVSVPLVVPPGGGLPGDKKEDPKKPGDKKTDPKKPGDKKEDPTKTDPGKKELSAAVKNKLAKLYAQ